MDAQTLRQLEERFVRHHVARIVQRGMGTGPEGEWCARIKPQRTYFIGSLSAQKEHDSLERKRLDERYSPNSCGLEFRAATRQGQVQVTAEFSLYLPSYPTMEMLEADAPNIGRHYRRHRVSFQSEPVNLAALLEEPQAYAASWNQQLQDLITFTVAGAAADPYTVKAPHGTGHTLEEIPVGPEPRASDSAYLAFLETQQNGAHPYVPAYKVTLKLEVRQDAEAERLRIFLTNETPDPPIDKDPDLDGGLYGVALRCECRRFRPVPIRLQRSTSTDYRYQFASHGRGINCSLTEKEQESGDLILCTEFAPNHEQKRYLPDERYQLYFADLAADPVPCLQPVAEAMHGYARDWERRIATKADGMITQEDQEQGRTYLAKFQREIARFEAGLAVLQQRDAIGQNLRRAFQLMNATFEQLDQWRNDRTGKRFRGWRMFQLVFVVSNLPELLARAQNQGADAPVELLYFPTGGGKTEAMMGIVVTALFFDRFRGRKRGVTSWMRFPLRLLTFQQMQRYLDITAAAEVIRSQHASRFPALAVGDTFQIGYYGGSDNSPNDLRRFDSQSHWTATVAKEMSVEKGQKVDLREVTGFDVLRRHPEAFQRYRMVGDCPYCGKEESVTLVADEVAIALRHRCSECGQVLPLVIVDADIYAEVPSILVGTLDKIANIGFRLGARTLFGRADGRCRKHGYGTFGRCLKRDFDQCKHSDWESFKEKPIAPGISISFQDELHLLNEELGCFDAHYEAALDALCIEAGSVKPKVLAASATIEGAENQVDHLYRRRLERFPGEGPQLRETFYAKEVDRLQRVFCGLRPSGMQPLDMTMRLTATLAMENDLLRRFRSRAQSDAGYGFLSILSDDDYQKLVDRHCLLVPYVNSKPDGADIARSIEEQVQDAIFHAGCEPLAAPEMLTGDTEMADVKSILRRMTSPRYQATKEQLLDVVIATSMISHGVDVDRLNLMLFYSFPRSTAEYIQATSRAGRTYPGLVFVVLKASSQRDRSYFRHFGEVHYALDQMVEAVPIDRFAANAADRTVPGVALAWLLGAEADRLLTSKELDLKDARELDSVQTLRRLVAQEGILERTLTGALERIYEVSNPQGAQFASTIHAKLEALESNLARVEEGVRSIPAALNQTTTRVMTSLRDVDPGVPIEIENRVQRR